MKQLLRADERLRIEHFVVVHVRSPFSDGAASRGVARGQSTGNQQFHNSQILRADRGTWQLRGRADQRLFIEVRQLTVTEQRRRGGDHLLGGPFTVYQGVHLER